RFELRLFACQHVGLSQEYDVFELKRKLQPAIEELESIGYLVPLPVTQRYRKLSSGRWEILLERALGRPSKEDIPLSAIAGELTRRRINRRVAQSLAMSFSDRHIAEKIKMHDRLIAKGDKRISKNPPGFLAAAIRNDYQVLET